jgi:hypothetical protein
MAFTYELDSADAELVEVAQVRFHLGDTVESRGPRADHSNFSDEEVKMMLNSLDTLGAAYRPMKAVASLCEVLARDWSKIATISVGPRSQQYGENAKQWAARAIELRQRYGGGGLAFSVQPRRADGYAAHAAESTGME